MIIILDVDLGERIEVGLEDRMLLVGLEVGLEDLSRAGGGDGGLSVGGGEALPAWRGGERGRGRGEDDSSARPCENFPGFWPRTMKQGDILEKMK